MILPRQCQRSWPRATHAGYIAEVSANESVSLRVQGFDFGTQSLILAELVSRRSESALVRAAEILALFREFALPAPAKIGNVVGTLATKGLLTRDTAPGCYRVTPKGRAAVEDILSDLDLLALSAESLMSPYPTLGSTVHSLVPVALAPPALVAPLRRFLASHPFDTNVFGMTRFPDTKIGDDDPIAKGLGLAQQVCSKFGLEFHLASDRAIVDDLWTNVTAHMWASRFGVAFFEDRVDRGLNHNLLIEVGAMIMTGRRCALLKDGSIDRMPTDLVGMIYKSVNLDDESSVEKVISSWITDDLGIGQ